MTTQFLTILIVENNCGDGDLVDERRRDGYRNPRREARTTIAAFRAIAFFNLGRHGLTVFGMAVRICQRHGHGEGARFSF